MNSKLCVWVHEVAILNTSGDKILYWEVWDTFNTRKNALRDVNQSYKSRPNWVTAKFHKATNRVRKYVPASR